MKKTKKNIDINRILNYIQNGCEDDDENGHEEKM